MPEIRSMTFPEVQRLVSWANDEGWNPGLNDAECFWQLDPEGFLATSDGERFLGGGAIIRHSDDFGFMGLFIIDKAYRGQGLGTQLWFARHDKLLSRLKSGGTIGLDGVDAMVPFYQKGGFQPFTRHRRFQLNATPAGASRSAHVVPLDSVSIVAVADYDRCCFPARREEYLAKWLNQPGAVSLGYVRDGSLQGFGVMRPCIVGWKIGPLFADSLDIADALFQALQLESAGGPIFLDAPDNNRAALELCQKHQMEEVFGCVRMYLGPPPELDHGRIFGVTTLEVG
ncbi:MAG: GNAT family N-acetyltransferase [Planctomycetaceae bacterium]